MEAHSRNALELAQWLNAHPKVEKVFYAGLPNHVGHELAAKQQSAFGGVLSFRVKGGRDEAWKVIDATRIMSLHPATTTHGRLSPEQKADAGITENLIRVAVGLEDIGDLKADLARGLGIY